MFNVICVNNRDYLGCGQTYVDKLYRAVASNIETFDLLPGEDWQFHVLTEDEVDGAVGWWAKIHLFKPGLFEGRCLYFDLDTVIVGSLEDLVQYDGDFAGISDFYDQRRLQTGVMAWEAGEADSVYERWVACGKPEFPVGDAGWIGTVVPSADRLDRVFPGQIVSFKRDCLDGVPDDARVVCFHGKPRPHHLKEIMGYW